MGGSEINGTDLSPQSQKSLKTHKLLPFSSLKKISVRTFPKKHTEMKTGRAKKKKSKREAIASARAWADKRRRAREEEEVIVAEEVHSGDGLEMREEEEDLRMLRFFELKREERDLEREAILDEIASYEEQQVIVKAHLRLAAMKHEATQLLNRQKIEEVKREISKMEDKEE